MFKQDKVARLTKFQDKGFLYQEPNVYRIKSIQIKNLSDQELCNQSKAIINIPIAEQQKNGSLSDPHLGTMSDSQQCSTCYNTRQLCQGHVGHFNLEYPFVSPYMQKTVEKTLRHLCFDCNLITGINKKCRQCGKKAITIKAIRGYKYDLSFENKVHTVSLKQIRQRFTEISKEDMATIGIMIPPQEMILSNILISPLMTRPDKKIQASTTQNDGFTSCLQSIIRVGIILNEMPESDKRFDNTYNNFLRDINSYYVDNNKSDDAKGQKSLASLLGGKHGVIRSKMMGKHSQKLGRGVITCKIEISPDEVVIPQVFAMSVSIREKVHSYNFDRLHQLFKNGATQYPGANYIRKANGHKYQIGNSKVELEVGDYIYRHQINGDLVLMNRQPTLLPMSIGAHKIKVAPDPNMHTLGLNVICSNQYHFDFKILQN